MSLTAAQTEKIDALLERRREPGFADWAVRQLAAAYAAVKGDPKTDAEKKIVSAVEGKIR